MTFMSASCLRPWVLNRRTSQDRPMLVRSYIMDREKKEGRGEIGHTQKEREAGRNWWEVGEGRIQGNVYTVLQLLVEDAQSFFVARRQSRESDLFHSGFCSYCTHVCTHMQVFCGQSSSTTTLWSRGWRETRTSPPPLSRGSTVAMPSSGSTSSTEMSSQCQINGSTLG